MRQIQACDIDDAIKKMTFPVRRESVITDKTNVSARRDAIIRKVSDPDGTSHDKILGLVPGGREIIPYADITGWVEQQFQKSGIQYTLKTSDLCGQTDDLYQEYVFDIDMDTPDGQDVSPMVIVRASMVNVPLKLMFGTYRFVCSNGVTIGNTFRNIKIASRNVEALRQSSLGDEFRQTLDKMNIVSDRYRVLSEESFEEYLQRMFESRPLPLEVKKSTLYAMQADGLISISQFPDKNGVLKDARLGYDDFLGMTYDSQSHMVLDSHKKEVLSIRKDISAYELYQYETDVCTHAVLNLDTRSYGYMHISNMFQV